MLNRRLFAFSMTVLFDHFNKKMEKDEVGKTLMNWWYDALSDLSDEEFKTACQRVFLEERFMPSPLEFRFKVQPSSEEKALEEWSQVLKSASNPHRKPPLSAAGEAALQDLGGLRGLGQMNTDQLHWVKKDFLSSYKTHYTLQLKMDALKASQDSWSLEEGETNA